MITELSFQGCHTFPKFCNTGIAVAAALTGRSSHTFKVPASFAGSCASWREVNDYQKRIVAKVEEVLGRVTAARERLAKAPAILKRCRQAVLAAACSGRLTEEWQKHAKADSWRAPFRFVTLAA